MKAYLRFFLVAGVVGLIALSFFDFEIDLSLNGSVCNRSSTDVWLTITERGRQKPYLLAPGECTDMIKQDAEAIWGKSCANGSCSYQAWKLGAGHFEVYDKTTSASGFVLRIQGWGAGSRWHITREWAKPDLSAISYSLTR